MRLNIVPPVLQTIIVGYVGAKTCYLLNLLSPHPLLAEESKEQKHEDVLIHIFENQWMEAIVLIYDKHLIDANTILIRAAKCGYIPAMDYAVSRGADNWNYAAYSAASNGHMHTLEYAVSRGATDWNGVLWNSSFHGHIPVMEYAAYHGATHWNLALSNAASSGNLSAIKFAVSRGANQYAGALNIAMSGGHASAIEYLEPLSRHQPYDFGEQDEYLWR